ncbi:class F sortase [Sphaerisporangium corydalis]|uniref:Class F sortase n=1 Tax=Sphaerisporangium corydalis TaxID=1441875 RepID=A0ABV9EG00_9ACTN|nr:class F sortase [Sphaerisporangium corydalis]
MPDIRRSGGRLALGAAATAVTLTGAVLAGRGLLQDEPPPAPPPATAQAVQAYTSPSGSPALARSLPRLLDVPKIGVHVALGRLGLNADGTVRVPPVEHPEQAGWYSRGATPGERGAAVILGHVDGGGRKGVFYDLGRLRRGDAISVLRADGTVAAFVVDSVEKVAKSRFPSRRVYGPLTYAGLRLVTCGGTFDRRTGHYTSNVIAYAHLA